MRRKQGHGPRPRTRARQRSPGLLSIIEGSWRRRQGHFNFEMRVAEEAVAEIRAREEAERAKRERAEAEASAKVDYDMK